MDQSFHPRDMHPNKELGSKQGTSNMVYRLFIDTAISMIACKLITPSNI